MDGWEHVPGSAEWVHTESGISVLQDGSLFFVMKPFHMLRHFDTLAQAMRFVEGSE